MLSIADTQLVRRDLHLPGLALLLDADEFSRRLAPLLPGLRDFNLICTYLRYKPGTNCLAAYRIQDTSLEEPIQLYAKAFPSSADPKFLKEANSREPKTHVSDGVLILRDAAIIVRIFPADGRIPALREIVSPSRERLLQKLLPEHPELWKATPQVVSYKPERRCVLRLDDDSGRQASVRCYAPREFAAADAYGFRSAGVLQIPQRLGCSRRHQLLSFDWVEGRPLGELLPDSPYDALRQTGEALAELHRQNIHGLDFRSRQDELRHLKSIAQAVEQLCPELSRRCSRLVPALADRLLTMSPMAYPIHGDFYAEQVLVSAENITILDFDEVVFGDPASDLGNFAAHLDRQILAGRMSVDSVESLMESLLDGYRQVFHVPRQRVDVYRAANLLRQAMHPFRYRVADWPDQIEKIIARVETLLAASGPARNPLQSNQIGFIQQSFTNIENHGVLKDPKLAFLAPALDRAKVICRFNQILPHWPGIQESLRLHDIRVVRHKPGRRCLIEYEIDQTEPEDDSARQTLIGKVNAKRPDLFSYRIQQTLFEGSFHQSAEDGISTPETLGIIPEWHMWLQRKVKGDRVTLHLESEGAEQLARRIAQAIDKLHRSGAPAGRRHTPNDELSILHKRVPKVTRKRPEWREPIRRILSACARLASSLPENCDAVLHRDFYPDQILIDDSSITLLDLDLCCLGDPALDIGNFHAHLTEHALRHCGRADAMNHVQDAFLEGYMKLAGDESHSRIQLYSTLTLVRHIYLSTLFPDRQHLTPTLIELSAQHLGVRLEDSAVVHGV